MMKETMNSKAGLGLLNSAQELRQLIIDNPELPLLVFAGEDANIGDYSYTTCSYVNASIGEFLDCSQLVNSNQCYIDRDTFEEDLDDYLYMYEYDEYRNSGGSDEGWNEYVDKKIAEYAPYWKKCIILYVDN